MRTAPLFGLFQPVSALSHLLAAVATLVGAYFLLRKGRGSLLRVGALAVFCSALLFLFAMSGVYHSLEPGPWRLTFKRLDYAAIWLVIAGSATPIHILLMRGFWRWGVLALFWVAAILFLLFVNAYIRQLPYWAVVSCYLIMGWLGLGTVMRLVRLLGWARTQGLIAGGLAYTAGAVIDFIGRPVLIPRYVGPHELFHFLVMIGATLHYVFIFGWADARLIRGRTYLKMFKKRLLARWRKD